MIKVKQLYVVFDDGYGHKYLIPEDKWEEFKEDFDQIVYEYDVHEDDDIFYSQLETRLEAFSDGKLEGELHYVVLDEHVIKGED